MPLRSFALFSGVPENTIKNALKSCRYADYRKREMVLASDDVNRGVWFLYGGAARLTRCSESGSEVMIRELKPGEFCGVEATLTNTPFGADLTTTVASMFIVMPSKTFIDLMNVNPIGIRVAAHLARTASHAHERIFSLATETAGPRARREIIDALQRHELFAASEIASRVCTTRETVAREITKLINEGKIVKHSLVPQEERGSYFVRYRLVIGKRRKAA